MPFLNLDAGERAEETEDLWSLADLLNCACGGHAGDATSMDRVAAFCARGHVWLGAHPSYADRAGFGRRSPLDEVAAGERQQRARDLAGSIESAILEQCGALRDAARRHAATVVAVKPHGALYHDATLHQPMAAAILRAAVEALGRNITVIGPPAGALRDEARRLELTYAREGFADRRLRPDGSLAPRSEPGALIDDPVAAAAQARTLAANVDTICIHADTPGALAIARQVRAALAR